MSDRRTEVEEQWRLAHQAHADASIDFKAAMAETTDALKLDYSKMASSLAALSLKYRALCAAEKSLRKADEAIELYNTARGGRFVRAHWSDTLGVGAGFARKRAPFDPVEVTYKG